MYVPIREALRYICQSQVHADTPMRLHPLSNIKLITMYRCVHIISQRTYLLGRLTVWVSYYLCCSLAPAPLTSTAVLPRRRNTAKSCPSTGGFSAGAMAPRLGAFGGVDQATNRLGNQKLTNKTKSSPKKFGWCL